MDVVISEGAVGESDSDIVEFVVHPKNEKRGSEGITEGSEIGNLSEEETE